jgi:hypothetical protein
MSLNREWIPSPNCSSSRPRSRLLVVHTSEGATTFRSLGNFLANPSAEVSYHVGFDDTTATSIGEYVKPPGKSWSAHSANSEGEHGCCCVPSGAAQGWTRGDWLARPRMLDACGAWLREEAGRYGVPLVKIDGGQIRAGASGVCGHKDCVDAGLGGSHTDPGPNFPWDVVLSGAAPAPQPKPEEAEMWTVTGEVPAGKDRDSPGTATFALPANRKSARLQMYAPCPPSEGVSLWAAQCLSGKNHGLWGGGNTWEQWLNGSKPFDVDLSASVYAVTFKHMGGTAAPLTIAISGT